MIWMRPRIVEKVFIHELNWMHAGDWSDDKESKKTSERNYKVNMNQPQGKPKNILIFRFNDQTSKPADTFKPPQHSFS